MKERSSDLDRTDRKILKILQKQGRISNADLARNVHLSPTPCLFRVRRLEQEGYIEGYEARLNPAKLGLGLTVFIQVRVEQNNLEVFEQFAKAVRDMPEIVECHMVTGGFDFILKIRIADTAGYRYFMAERLPLLPGVTQTHSHVVIDEIKEEHSLPIED